MTGLEIYGKEIERSPDTMLDHIFIERDPISFLKNQFRFGLEDAEEILEVHLFVVGSR